MQIDSLQPKTKSAQARRIGRGGKRGKTSGRGHKGQKARAGRKLRPESRDMIKKIPKLRGRGIHPNKSIKNKPATVNLAQLEGSFEAKAEVNPKVLIDKGLVKKRSGKVPAVKILGRGDLSKALKITDCLASETVRQKVEEKGGSVS